MSLLMRSGLALLFTGLLTVVTQAGQIPPLEGLIEPSELVDFSSQVPGILETLNVERGDLVKKGQVLARLKSGPEEASVNLAQARLEFNKRKSLRNEELYKKQLISIHEKDEIETEIELAQLELAEAHERLKLRTIYSTLNGVVVERKGASGEYVGEEPFLTVARIHPLNVEVVVPVTYLGLIKKGQFAQVKLEEPLGQSYKAKIVIVDRVVDAGSGTFGVRLELPNPKLTLPAGLKCQVFF